MSSTEWPDDASPGMNSLLFDPGLHGRLGVPERPVRTKAREKKNSTSPPVLFNGRWVRECEAGEQMTSLTSFPGTPSLPCSPWEAKWKQEPKKRGKKGRKSLSVKQNKYNGTLADTKEQWHQPKVLDARGVLVVHSCHEDLSHQQVPSHL